MQVHKNTKLRGIFEEIRTAPAGVKTQQLRLEI